MAYKQTKKCLLKCEKIIPLKERTLIDHFCSQSANIKQWISKVRIIVTNLIYNVMLFNNTSQLTGNPFNCDNNDRTKI